MHLNRHRGRAHHRKDPEADSSGLGLVEASYGAPTPTNRYTFLSDFDLDAPVHSMVFAGVVQWQNISFPS